jgi:hypothetical protein
MSYYIGLVYDEHISPNWLIKVKHPNGSETIVNTGETALNGRAPPAIEIYRYISTADRRQWVYLSNTFTAPAPAEPEGEKSL